MDNRTPKGWNVIPAEEYCVEVTDGTHDSPKSVDNNGYYLLTSKNITSGILNYDNAYHISEDDFNAVNKRSKVRQYDLLYSMIGTVGESCIVEQEEIDFAIKNVGLFRLGGDLLKAKWLNYFFKTRVAKAHVEKSLKGTTQKYIALGILRKFPILVPSVVAEQEEIVQVLDAMSEIIRLRKECIQHAQDLITVLFQEMFGDSINNVSNSKIVRLGECVELNPAKPNLANDLNVTFLGMKDISENGQVDLSTTKTYEEVKKGFTNFENEDVLLAKITPCFENGKAAIVRNLTNGYGFGSTEFYVLRANQNIILPEYVYSIIKSFAFAIPGRQKMTGAAGQKRLPKGYVLNYKIPLPDLELQIQYAEKLNEINSYIQEQQEELKNANQMLQSLLHHAFNGELTRRAYGKD